MLIKRPISKHYPVLAPLIREIRISAKSIRYIDTRYLLTKTKSPFPYKVYRSKSPLYRKLGSTPKDLQEAKVINLNKVIPLFNDLEIKPNQILSFWNVIGRPTYKRGFVDGMLLSDGKVITGVGGGLCQLANMLYWIFLHSPITVLEHHHHSYDIFPDSGRVLPFGSGASVFYNYIDLQFLNATKYSYRLNFWIKDGYLHGDLHSNTNMPYSYSVTEKDHHFYKEDNKVYRHNVLYKQVFDKSSGNLLEEHLIRKNDAKVLYQIEETVSPVPSKNIVIF